MDDALAPPAAASLARWHAMVAAADLSGLEEIVHPDAVFTEVAARVGKRLTSYA